MPDIFARLDSLAERFDFEGVEREAYEALQEAAGADREDLWAYVAWARFELGRLEPALAAAEEAGDWLLAAKAHFHLWQFVEAQRCLDAFDEGEDVEHAEAEWYRGVLEEFRGGNPDSFFRHAALLAGDLFHEPVRLAEAEVEAVVKAALDTLPDAVRREVDNAVIVMRPLPDPHPDIDPLSLGLYLGFNRFRAHLDDEPAPPPQIELYLKNIERMARDRDEAVEELRITLLHEIGHHVGMEEEDLDDVGYG